MGGWPPDVLLCMRPDAVPMHGRLPDEDQPNFHGERFAEFPNKRFAAIVDAAGLTGGPPRCCRTYASHFLRAVPDRFELARVLGHSHVRITELYTHVLPGHLERSRNAVSLPAFPENSPERGQSVDP